MTSKPIYLTWFASIIYCLVWTTELLLAEIGLVFPALVLGYKLFNCSMCQVPVPKLIDYFVWLYFKQLLLVTGSVIFWHTNSRSLQSIMYQFLCIMIYLNDYLKQLVCVAGSIIFGIRILVASKVSNTDPYIEKNVWAYFKQLVLEHILNS